MGSRLPSPEILRELLRYEPETGKLFWRERDVKWFRDGVKTATQACASWNAKWANRPAFTSINKGYCQGRIFAKRHEAQRVIWCMVTGEVPTEIDHENGVKSDNRWVNLSNKTHKDNMKNMPIPSHNKSGVMGVSWCNTFKKWRAVIQLEKGKTKVRYRATKDAAILARKAMEIEYGFHANHGRRAA